MLDKELFEFIENSLLKFKHFSSYVFSIIKPLFIGIVAHFSGFIFYFDAGISVLLDTGSIARFTFSAFLFIGIILAIVRTVMYLVFILFSSKFTDFLLNKVGVLIYFIADKFNYNEYIPEYRVIEIAQYGVGYFFGLMSFSYFYIGKDMMIIFIVSLFGLPFIIFCIFSFRNSFVYKNILDEIVSIDYTKILFLSIVIYASLLGFMRANYISKSTNYIFSKHIHCGKHLDNGYIIDAVIILTSANGAIVYLKKQKNTVFIPWDKGHTICINAPNK